MCRLTDHDSGDGSMRDSPIIGVEKWDQCRMISIFEMVQQVTQASRSLLVYQREIDLRGNKA